MIQLIRSMKSALAATSLGLALMFAGHGAHAAVGESVFYWNGNCIDCAIEAGQGSYGVTGILTLSDYELGDPITLGDELDPGNFVSFSYSGSNLVDPFSVNPTGDDGNPATNDFAHSTVYLIGGAINESSVPGPNRFEIAFFDGLFFQTQVDASWSTCAPKGNDFYGGNSCGTFPPQNADFGNAAQFTITPVPEPEIWVMFGAGLGLLAFLHRRRVAIAG